LEENQIESNVKCWEVVDVVFRRAFFIWTNEDNDKKVYTIQIDVSKINLCSEHTQMYSCLGTIGSAQTRASLCYAFDRRKMRPVGCFKLCFTFS
jgi:hypothetical protein